VTLPWYLWGGGAQSVGLHLPKIDKVRCSSCRRWTRLPAWYGPPNIGPAAVPETDRVLCPKCHAPLVEKAKAWAGLTERSEL
jgi:hypothetical protein